MRLRRVMAASIGLVLVTVLLGGGESKVRWCMPTKATTEGPYYKPNAPTRDNDGKFKVCDWDQYGDNASELLVYGKVYDEDCLTPVAAQLDVWSADPWGGYSPLDGPDYTCRAKLQTNSDGYYEFYTVLPGRYLAGGFMRPSHIHYKIHRLNETSPKILTTQQYFIGDPFFRTDPCPVGMCSGGDPSLTMSLQDVLGKDYQSFALRFDVVLSREGGGYYGPASYDGEA